MFKQEISRFNIPLDNQNSKTNITHYKKWYLSDLNEHHKYRTYYIKENSNIFSDFETKIYDIIEELLKANGISFSI